MPVYAWPKAETLAISLRCNSSSQTMQLSKSHPARGRGNPNVRRDSRGLVGVPGVEPGTSSLSGTRSNQLSYTPSPPRSPPPLSRWWRQPGSNRRHPACKAGALPTELCPRGDVSLDARSSAGRTALAVRKGCGRHRLVPAGLMCGTFPSPPPRRVFHHRRGVAAGLLLRKEVIQPLVPQRLPCYDFIPITTHTLDGSPPCGMVRRLRVQTAFMM